MKPVLFLDVDDTLIQWPGARPAVGVTGFFRWAQAHFEVRWLTMWAVQGFVPGKDIQSLSALLGVTADEIKAARNPFAFPVFNDERQWTEDWRAKHHSIIQMLAQTPEREWAWVEDSFLTPQEREFTENHPGRYFETITSKDRMAPLRTAEALAKRFVLPPLELVLSKAA